MNGLIVEVCASMQEQQQQKEAKIADSSTTVMEDSAAVPPPPPPPPSHRRPRVREVSSRFMSPVVSSSTYSSSPLPKQQQQQRSTSVQRQQQRRRQLDMEPLCCSDENRPIETVQIQSLETSSSLPFESQCNKPNLTSSISTQRKQRPAVKNFKENGGVGGGKPEQYHQHPSRSFSGKIGNSAFNTPSRPDTPMVSNTNVDRMMAPPSTRLRRSTNITAAAKLLQSSGMSLPAQPLDPSLLTSHDNDHNPLRSSMPEPDMLPTVSGRLLADKFCNRGNLNGGGGDSFKISASPCSRSLNMPLLGCDHPLFPSNKGGEKPPFALSKPLTNSMKMTGSLCLPPVPPPCAKLGTDTRKGRKVSTHQEDVHSLRLLHNRYLQWRYANAKAETLMQAQQRETERTLYSLGAKLSELYDSVKRKRIELGLLQRMKSLSTILEAQIPYLEEWSALEEDYLISLSEAIQALLNASLQLPIGNVRADTIEVGEALNSASKMMEIIICNVQNFIPKAEETENLVSELARVIGGEKASIEECGVLLSKTCTSQVEEFSLRSQLIQMHKPC